MDFKDLFASVALIFVFIGYVPYFRDIFRGKTQPHLYSWLIWTVVTWVAAALQLGAGAGAGAWVTIVTAILCTAVLIFSLPKARENIKRSDALFLVLSGIAIIARLVFRQPVIAIVLVTLIDVLGFIPTVRKSWEKPYTETLSFYLIGSGRFVFASLAIEEYSVVSTLYPVGMLLINILVSSILIWRRRVVSDRTIGS